MLIGEDFTKIALEFNGLTLLEPNALITDFIMGGLSIYIAIQLKKIKSQHSFLKYWHYFFLIFGIGAFCGGLAHSLFEYTGPQGKFPTWISAILCAYFIEKAMIKSVGNLNKNNILGKIAFTKMILIFLIVITVISTKAYQEEHTIGFIPIAINTLIGVFISVAFFSFYNIKRGYKEFKYWLDEGWSWVAENESEAPLYWHKIDGKWHYYTLSGLKPVDEKAILSHVSFYESR